MATSFSCAFTSGAFISSSIFDIGSVALPDGVFLSSFIFDVDPVVLPANSWIGSGSSSAFLTAFKRLLDSGVSPVWSLARVIFFLLS
jgi:hypothetical protein